MLIIINIIIFSNIYSKFEKYIHYLISQLTKKNEPALRLNKIRTPADMT